jgi:CheY-like chemotaxis protein
MTFVIGRMLSDMGFILQMAENGAEAVKYVQQSKQISMVLIDLTVSSSRYTSITDTHCQ